VKTTNFLTKDSLPDSDAGKIIRGSEFDTEFNNLVIAIASKSNLNSPEFTGVPKAPTATTGSNTTQIATTAFVTTAAANVKNTLGTMAQQNSNAVNITGGTITGLSKLETANGSLTVDGFRAANVGVGANWTLHQSGSYLYFRYGSNNVLRLASNGHLVAENNITAFQGV
jgi:hypothetical protein